MKLLTLVAFALLTTGSAFAATTPTTSMPTATPAPSVQPVERRSATLRCEKEAKEKNLSGDAEKSFVKDCRAGKKN